MITHHLAQGRPGQLLWMFTFALDSRANQEIGNLLLRLLQGALHALAAVLAAAVLQRHNRDRVTWISGLPFLLWGYNGEAVLWRSAGTYPAAALLGLLALWVLRASRSPARALPVVCSLITAGILTNQLAAAAALVVWVLAAGLALADGTSSERLRSEAACLAGAYLVAAALSVGIARSQGAIGRATWRVDPQEWLHFLKTAALTFTADSELYPPLMGIAVVAAHAITLFIVLVFGLRAPKSEAWASIAVLATLFTPYASLVPFASGALELRGMYLAPLLFAGALAQAARLLGRQRAIAITQLALTLLLSLAYARIGWGHSGGYPDLFEADRRVAEGADCYAAARGLRVVVIAFRRPDEQAPPPGNPHGLDQAWRRLPTSSLIVPWSAGELVQRYATLPLIWDIAGRAQCSERCQGAEAGRFGYEELPALEAVCLCRP